MWHNFWFYMEKCSVNADADVSKVYHSVSPNPVRCPVKRAKDIAMIVVAIFLRPNGRMWDYICVTF